MDIYCVKEVEQNPLPKSQIKLFYIGTKEAPSVFATEESVEYSKQTSQSVKDKILTRSSKYVYLVVILYPVTANLTETKLLPNHSKTRNPGVKHTQR